MITKTLYRSTADRNRVGAILGDLLRGRRVVVGYADLGRYDGKSRHSLWQRVARMAKNRGLILRWAYADDVSAQRNPCDKEWWLEPQTMGWPPERPIKGL